MASVSGTNGFASVVTLQISGLPSGVTFSPANPQITPGTPLQITFSAATTVAASAETITVTGTSGAINHSAPLSLTVKAAPITASLPRTRYVRTDAVTEYFLQLNKNWMVYDPVTNRFFVSDPDGNRVVALDAGSRSEIKAIPVPGAFGIDESPDHSVIYAGTQIGDVYAIDPVSMQVTQRYLAAQIGIHGFAANSVRVLANGELALMGNQGSVPSTDTYSSVAVWNPSSNAITTYGGTSPFCVEKIEAFTLTGDRSLMIIGGTTYGGVLCTLNPATGQQTSVSPPGDFAGMATTPDGKSLLLPVYGGTTGQVVVLNAQTLAQTSIFSVAGDTSTDASLIVSPDSQTLFIDGEGALYAYDIASGQQIGWLPNLTVEPLVGGYALGPISAPNLQAFDGTGLLAGPMEEGVGFLDTAALRTGPVGSLFANDYLVPATGPASGGTQTMWENLSPSANLTAAYFGMNPASAILQSSTEFYATTPSGSPGPVDVSALTADGGMLIVPEGFSYGPTILEVTPNMSTAEGGGTGIVYGYGFGPTEDNSPIPTDLQITVGGKSITVTGYAPNAYNLDSPPFNLQAAAFSIPQGAAGTSSDVEVTTPSGSATSPGAIQYLPAVKQFPLSGAAALAQGIYDPKRDVYYFTDASEIRVFSRTQAQWLPPIQVPPLTSGTHRLWGIALSPDGSKLAVSDSGAALVYLLDPDSPNSIQSFPVSTYDAGTPINLNGVITYPSGLAISDSGSIYYAAFILGGDGFDGFFKLDTNSGQITDYRVVSLEGNLYRAAIASDNSQVFFNNDGDVFSVDTANDTVTHAADSPTCCYGDFELALSSGQTTLEATSYLYDKNLDAESYLVLNDRDALNISYVYGAKLSADGTLLFQPSTNGIDVFDGRLGMLIARISLPVALSQNFDALVADGKDNVLIAITGQTGTGVAVIDLTSLSEPPPLPYASRQDRPNNTSLHGKDASVKPPNAPSSSANTPRRRVPTISIKHVANSLASKEH